MTKLKENLVWAACAIVSIGAGLAFAQAQDFSKVEIKTIPVVPGISMLQGQGGNIAVSVGENGPVIVDDQFAPLAPKIQAAVKALQDEPIRFVVNTHWHFDHTGGNEPFGQGGALIVAHQNVRARMSTKQFMAGLNREFPPSPAVALPVVTFEKDVTLHWNGEDITVSHVSSAHTDGDSFVWFRKANVVHTGDVFVNGQYPFIDMGSGGSFAGVLAAAESLIAQVNDETRIIPGHGPLSRKADVVAYRDMLLKAKTIVSEAVAKGTKLPDLLAAKPFAEYDKLGQGFIRTDQFLTFVYTELSKK